MAFINFQPKDYFNTVLWSGNSTGDNANQNITGVGFQPDFFWNKSRNQAENNIITDVLRGTNKFLRANDTTAEYTPTCNQTPISDGFTATGDEGGEFNNNGFTYATWNLKANGAGSSNTDGSITSTVSASTTSGFSIVKWTGSGGNATIGHGLGVVPKMIIIKSLANTTSWMVYTAMTGNNSEIALNTTASATGSSTAWQDTDPTSSVFYVAGGAGDGVNASGDYVAYCFAEKKGFSKFGSYSANNNADGPMIYTGFSPAFVMIKSSNDTRDWCILDNKRPAYNIVNKDLRANEADVESTQDRLDFLSNGFKLRNASGAYNSTGNTYIFMAFAEEPLVSSNGVPAVAR